MSADRVADWPRSSGWLLPQPLDDIVGIPVSPVAIDITELQATEVRIENIFRYANVYQKAIDLVANGKLNLKPFITDTYAMEDAKAAFDRMAEGRPGDIKLQITVNND